MTTIITNLHRRILPEFIRKSKKAFYSQPTTLLTKDSSSDDQEVVTYVKRDDDFKVSRAAAVRRLVKHFEIDEFKAIDLVANCKPISQVNGIQLEQYLEVCRDHGVKKKTILRCLDVLAVKNLPQKIIFLKKLGDVNDVFPLLRLSETILVKLESDFRTNFNSIYYLSDLLKVPPLEVSEEFVNKRFLHRIRSEKILQVVDLLKENKVSGEMIAKDLTVLKYSVPTIKSRIEMAKAFDVPEFKTWMIRVNPQIFSNYIKLRSDDREILGDKTVAEYLSERLGCSVAMANYLVTKLPALNSKSVKKMSELIDYLIANGYSQSQICRVPKILLHSLETTKKRHEKLKQLGAEVSTLYVMIKSQRAFQEFLDNLVKKLKKS